MITIPKFHIMLIAAVLTLSIPYSSHAHKVRVFAYESGGTIITEAKFNSGRPAKNSTVTVTDSDGTIVLNGTTDENGLFRFTPPATTIDRQVDLTISVDLGEGHKGYWHMKASDYIENAAISQNTETPESITPPINKTIISSQPETKNECSDIHNLIKTTIAAEIAPIKRMMVENMTPKTSFHDILGGLGYIFGLAGIAAYFRYKKSGGNT